MIDMVLKGAMVSGGLIMALGSQNAFVLRQGLLKQNVFYVSAICFICDMFLMTAGVIGLGLLIKDSTVLMNFLTIGGAIFLYGYGFCSFKNSYHGDSQLKVEATQNKNTQTVQNVIAATLAITLLNPHVYLDTVVIVGGIGGTLTIVEKVWFLIGALAASFIWFFSLGYGARLLIPLFKKNKTWQILDFGIGIMMWWIATELLMFIV